LEHLLALLQVEERLALLGVAQRSHDDLVEQARGTLDDLEMAVVNGSNDRDEGDGHDGACSPWAAGSGVAVRSGPRSRWYCRSGVIS